MAPCSPEVTAQPFGIPEKARPPVMPSPGWIQATGSLPGGVRVGGKAVRRIDPPSQVPAAQLPQDREKLPPRRAPSFSTWSIPGFLGRGGS